MWLDPDAGLPAVLQPRCAPCSRDAFPCLARQGPLSSVVCNVPFDCFFKPYPRLLDCRHAVPREKYQPKLACPMNDKVGTFQGFVLHVGGSGNVRKLEKFFDGGKYGCHRVSRMMHRLLDYVLALEEFIWH